MALRYRVLRFDGGTSYVGVGRYETLQQAQSAARGWGKAALVLEVLEELDGGDGGWFRKDPLYKP